VKYTAGDVTTTTQDNTYRVGKTVLINNVIDLISE